MNLYIKVVNLSKKIKGGHSCQAFFKDYRDFPSLNLAIAPRSANSAFWYALRVFSAIDPSGNLSRLLRQGIYPSLNPHNLTNIHETLEFISYRLRTTTKSRSDF